MLNFQQCICTAQNQQFRSTCKLFLLIFSTDMCHYCTFCILHSCPDINTDPYFIHIRVSRSFLYSILSYIDYPWAYDDSIPKPNHPLTGNCSKIAKNIHTPIFILDCGRTSFSNSIHSKCPLSNVSFNSGIYVVHTDWWQSWGGEDP
jgi:hypothetical protein